MECRPRWRECVLTANAAVLKERHELPDPIAELLSLRSEQFSYVSSRKTLSMSLQSGARVRFTTKPTVLMSMVSLKEYYYG